MGWADKDTTVPIWDRATLTLKETAAYTGIGIKKLRRMTDETICDYVLWAVPEE